MIPLYPYTYLDNEKGDVIPYYLYCERACPTHHAALMQRDVSSANAVAEGDRRDAEAEGRRVEAGRRVAEGRRLVAVDRPGPEGGEV